MVVTLSLFAGVGAQFFDNNGIPLTGGKIYTYAAGTTTALATYTTNLSTAFHTNPIILDAAGRLPSGGEMWLQLGVGYKFVVKTASEVLIATYDNIPSSAQPPAANDADSIMYEQGYTVVAGGFVAGKIYRIATLGTTNFVSIGATSNTVGVHFIATGAGTGTGTAELSQTVEAKLRENLSVMDFGAIGNYNYLTAVGTDDTAAFQIAATACDTQGLASIYIPSSSQNYLISAPIVFKEPGVNIYGTAGAGGGDRGHPWKNGKVFLANGVPCAFDLGGSRTTGNQADAWTIKNVSVMAVVANQNADAFRFTSKTDGPDRFALVRECSACFMNAGVSVPSRGTASALATLIIENCFFSSNRYGVLALSGNIFGARIVGNQIEQNLTGGIWGAFNGPVYIADNMLEGQPQAITITTPEVIGGNLANIVIERNYFEFNGGSWVIKIIATVDTSVTIRDNFWNGVVASDHIVLTGAGNCLLTVREELFRPVPVTFEEYGGVISYGSDFLNNVTPYFNVRTFNPIGDGAPFIITADYQNFVYPLDAILEPHVESEETGVDHYDTPYGNMACATYGVDVNVPLSVVVSSAVSLSIYCKIEEGADFVISILNQSKTATLQTWTSYDARQITVNGRWALVTIPFLSSGVSNGLWVRVTAKTGSTGQFLIAGISASNWGAHNNNGSNTKAMYPRMPNRVVTQVGSNYAVTGISGATAIVDTRINPIKNDGGVIEISAIYDVIVTGQTDATSNADSSIAYGVITVFNTGSSYTMAYTQTGAVGDNPLTVTAVFWNGFVETSTFSGTGIQMRIKVAGYLNNTGYLQQCRIIRRL